MKAAAIEILRQWPCVFDGARTLSRWLGRSDRLFLVLGEALSKLGGDWTFLQAGAHDGLRNDPFREFIISHRGARGVLVEPWPVYFERLRCNYRRQAHRLSFLSCVITYPPQVVEFHSFTEAFVNRHKLDPILLSTAALEKAHLYKQVRAELLDDYSIVTRRLPGRTVEEIMQLSGHDRLDALFLDLEGHEPNVLMNVDLEKLHTRLIVYESKHLGADAAQVESRLRSLGFQLQACEDDTLAVRAL